MRFHVVYNDDGETRDNYLGQPGLNIGFDEVMNAIRDLNVAFNQFNIFFKYYGFDQVNESDYLVLETLQELNDLRNSSYSIPDAINIYIVNGVVYGAAARTTIFDDDYFVYNWTINHELGHFFGLVHPDFSNGICEHATRVFILGAPDHLQFNADIRGDGVVDTHVYTHQSYYDNNCNYNGGGLDCEGTPVIAQATAEGYMVYPTFQNYMYATYSFDGLSCSLNPVFTPGQGKRMRDAIIGYWANDYNQTRNTVESLYQPFETTLIAGNVVVSTEDLGNGYAKVCRNILEKHRFQKGFDYVFPDNNGNPDQLSAGVNDLPFDINHTYDYRVVINQLGSQVEGIVPVVCTRGVICADEQYIGGEDIIMDFLGSYNFTIEEWDKLKVSDPNLYNTLQSNKYHIIKKETETGVIIEVTLYKS